MSKKTVINLLLSFFIIFSFVWLYIEKPGGLQNFDKKFIDILLSIRGAIPASKDIVIVDLDEKSLKELGQWPWQRNKFAKVLENLSAAGAGIIGLDIVFAEPDNSSPSKVLKEMGIKYKDAPDFDRMLAKTMKSTPTIAGYVFGFEESETVAEERLPSIPAIFIEKNKLEHDYLLDAKTVTLNIPLLQDSVYSSGFFNTFPDRDGIIRSVPLIIKYQDQIYPSLSLEMIRAVLGAKKVTVSYSEVGVSDITLGKFSIPTDRHGRLFVNFRGKSRSYKYLSAVDIYNNSFDKKDIEGKIVLIGTSAPGLLDLRATPFENVFAGVEVHANVIDNMINQDFIYRPPWAEGADIILILFVGLIMLFIFIIFEPFFVALLSLSLFFAFAYFNYYMMFEQGFILNIIFPLMTMITVFMFSIIVNYFFESKQKELIKSKFSKKVSSTVVEELMKKEDSKVLDTKEKRITIFFSDIRDFTSISEEVGSPKNLISLLNRYMTPMTDIIMRRQGTIDKFIGDSIMAYWNAPNDIKNHEDTAVKAAIEQIKKLKMLNEIFEKENLPSLEIGIGIHTGIATVGEMGSEGRSDYTVIGDSVNLASRLEGLNKFYGTHILISEDTKKGLKDDYLFRDIDTVRAKGKSKPVKIYEVLMLEDDNERFHKEIKLYNNALQLYKKADFAGAKEIFEELKEENELKLYILYLQRCDDFMKNPPEKFEGVWNFETK